MARRLTRKEIVQEDAIRKTLTGTSGWVFRHLKTLLIGFGILVLALIALLGWQSYSSSRNEEMQAAFGAALKIYHEQTRAEAEAAQPPATEEEGEQQAPTPEYKFETTEERQWAALAEFRAVAEKYPGSRIGDFASYYVGLCLVDLGKLDEAKTTLDTLVQDSDGSDITNLAHNSLAQLAAEAGSEEEATQHLEAILENPSESFPQQLILLRVAQLEESGGDLRGALERYRQIVSEYAGTSFAQRAGDEARRLELILGDDPAEEVSDPAAESSAEGDAAASN